MIIMGLVNCWSNSFNESYYSYGFSYLLVHMDSNETKINATQYIKYLVFMFQRF